jgi:glycosyltransferase involved in cell wall biosynthesis
MIEDINKYQRTSKSSYKFCVLIPTWNNYEFLKICVDSIFKNSHFEVQVIVIVNEGKDETIQWLEAHKEVDYIHSKNNIGICYGLNIARSLIKSDYVVYVNDDMYLLPKWDLALFEEIENIGTRNFMLSSTMIEPEDTGNPCVIVRNYGHDYLDFKEEQLLEDYSGLFIDDWSGSTWPPNVVPVDLWDLVGGLSIEFSPGMYSDPDLSRKLLEVGVRIFKGIGNSLVYHFGSKSTKRVKRNDGRKTFILKWGMSSRTFTTEYLKIGQPFSGSIEIPELSKNTLITSRLKRFISRW